MYNKSIGMGGLGLMSDEGMNEQLGQGEERYL